MKILDPQHLGAVTDWVSPSLVQTGLNLGSVARPMGRPTLLSGPIAT